MHRRRTLVGGASILTAALAGCLQERIGAGDDGPSDDVDGASPGSESGNRSGTGDESGAGGNESDGSNNDSDESDTESDAHDGSASTIEDYEVSEYVVEPDVEHVDDMDAWGVFIASRAVADDAFGSAEGEDADAVREFVEKTEFDAGEALLFVQAFAPQTCYDLRLDDEPRADEDGHPQVPLAVTRTAPEDQFCGEAITPVSLLARLSFDPEAPDAVSVIVSGHRDPPETLELESKQ